MSAAERGRLIAVSGVDGSGKSTLVAGIARTLTARGISLISLAALKPPVSASLAWMRGLSGIPHLREQAEQWMAGYFALAFQYNLACVVEPALDRGEWVLADRWSLDHVANQAALGLETGSWLAGLHAARRPDVHYLIDVTPDVAAQRIASRGGAADGVGTGELFIRRCARLMLRTAADPAFAPVCVLDGALGERQILDLAMVGIATVTTPSAENRRGHLRREGP
jgi:dTMP kinase